MPFHPVVDGEVLPAAADRPHSGWSRGGVDVLVGTNIDDWKLFLAGVRSLAPDHGRPC